MNNARRRSPSHHREALKLSERRAKVAELYRAGKRQDEIAALFGVTQQAISNDLKRVRDYWIASAVLDFNAAKLAELEKLDYLEREALDAWERSIGEHKTRRIEKATGRSEKDSPSAKIIETSEELAGDPRFIAEARSCIAKRCEILGLDAPLKHEVDGKLRIENVREKLAGKLARIVARAATQSAPGRADG